MGIFETLLTLLGYVLVTIIIEVIVVLIMGYRKKNFLYVVTLGNVITNPALNTLIIISYFFRGSYISSYMLIMLELLVIYVEFKLLYYVFKNKYSKDKLIKVAFVINGVSFIIGYIFRDFLFEFI